MSSPNETSYCRIDIPGTEISVHLRFGLLERLTADVEDVLAAGRESGGILLGSVSGNAIEVEDYDPVPSRHHSDSRFYLHSDVDRRRMAGAVALWSPQGESRLRVIGFYRSNDRPALVAGDEEREVFGRELSGATSVLLLVQPSAGRRTTLACYLAEHGHPAGREGQIEIDLKKPELPGTEGPAAATVSSRERKPQITATRREKSSSGLAWIAAILFAAGFLWLGYMQYMILKGMNAEASPAQRTLTLGLEVQPQGTYWRVSWNRSSELLAGAARGRLRIDDGDTRKDVNLDAAELPTTSVIYEPGGSELSFHLEVFGGDGGPSVAESLRVFAKLPLVTPSQSAIRSQARPADASSIAGMEPAGQSHSPSPAILPLPETP